MLLFGLTYNKTYTTIFKYKIKINQGVADE